MNAKANPCQIRPARESDLPDLLAMIRELAAFENLESQLQVTAASLREGLFGPHPVAGAVLALNGVETVGYAVYYYTYSTFVGRPGIFLEDVYVRPAWRNQGLGRALMEAVAKIGAERRCGRYEWIALRWNENALKFYRGLGAAELDEWVMLRMNETAMVHLAKDGDARRHHPQKTHLRRAAATEATPPPSAVPCPAFSCLAAM